MQSLRRPLPLPPRSHSLRSKALLLVAIFGLQVAAGASSALPTYAIDSGSSTMIGQGFDTCQDPSESAMQTWWPNTPWWWLGTYIGGSSMGCSQPYLSAQYLNNVHAQGWNFEPIWVGPQAPCTGFFSRFSYDPGTAYQQGRDQAVSAWFNLANLGFANGAIGTSIVYDLEAFNTADGACVTAANSFVQGWVDQMHVPPAQVAGVYGSTCASSLQTYAGGSPPPDFIWGASWDGNQSVWAMPCVNPGLWVFDQRLKQYLGGHNETWNGLTLNIDSDCARGPTSPVGVRIGSPCQ